MTEKNPINPLPEKKGVWVTLLILTFLTLLSIIVLYFIFENNYTNVNRSIKQINSIYEVIEDLERKNNKIENDYEKILDQQQKNSQSIKSLIKQSENQIRDKNLAPELQNINWLLAELEYLINLANTFYSLNENRELTIIAYEQALYKLENTKLSGLANIKNTIENELNHLKSSVIPSQDDKLNAIENIIDQINLLTIKEDSGSNNNEPTLQSSWSQNIINEIKERFQNIIIVRNHNSQNDPTLPKPPAMLIAAELRKMLYATKIAILNNRTEIYHELLIDIIDWIKTYYDPEADKTIVILNSLKKAIDDDFQYKKTDITESLKMIRDYKLNLAKNINN